eukprot:381139-Amphidinium_carterae.1
MPGQTLKWSPYSSHASFKFKPPAGLALCKDEGSKLCANDNAIVIIGPDHSVNQLCLQAYRHKRSCLCRYSVYVRNSIWHDVFANGAMNFRCSCACETVWDTESQRHAG